MRLLPVRGLIGALCVSALAASAGAEGVYRRSLERVASLDPAMASAVYAARAVQMAYEPLYDFDYRARPYRLIPALAAELPEVSTNGLTLRLRLDPEARFIDDPCFPGGKGRRVVAEDLVYSFRRLADAKVASPGAWVTERIASICAEDESTLRIELKSAFYPFVWYLAMTYTAAVPHEAVAFYGADFGSHAVGSGPYRLASWRRNHRFEFVRNEAWRGWRKGAASVAADRAFDRMVFNEISDVSTQWLCFLNGELDFLGEVSRDNWDAVIDDQGGLADALAARGVRLYSIPAMEVAYIGINMDDPFLGRNRKLRQALNCAFDFPAWQRFYNGRVAASTGPVPPTAAGADGGDFAYCFNLEKARRLMAEAGYAGGIDPQTGRRLELTIDLGNVTQDARESTELLASFYARIGISLKAQYHTWPAFLQMVSERRSQLFRVGWVGDYPDAENFLQLFYGPNASPGPNRCNFANPAFDRLYEAACHELDPARRAELWRQAQALVREECPWIFLHFPKSYSLAGPRLEGYVPSDFPYGSEKHLRLSK